MWPSSSRSTLIRSTRSFTNSRRFSNASSVSTSTSSMRSWSVRSHASVVCAVSLSSSFRAISASTEEIRSLRFSSVEEVLMLERVYQKPRYRSGDEAYAALETGGPGLADD